MSAFELFNIFFGVLLINNFILAKFLGLCPFFGVSKRTGDAVSMGLAVIFVMILACLATCLVIARIVPGLSWPVSIVGAAMATLIELLPIPLDDNLRIPLAAGFAMTLMQ